MAFTQTMAAFVRRLISRRRDPALEEIRRLLPETRQLDDEALRRKLGVVDRPIEAKPVKHAGDPAKSSHQQ